MNDSSESESQDEQSSEFHQSNNSSQETENSSDNEDSSDNEENEDSSDNEENEDSFDNEENEDSSDNEENEDSFDDDKTGNSSDTNENESSSDNEEIETSSSSINESSTDEDSEVIDEWNYRVPKRNLKSFSGNPNIPPQNYSKFRPIDFFKLLFTEQLFELVWKQTNIYGKQKDGANWIPISMAEITSWMGLNILMGYHKLPSYKYYWSSTLNFQVPIVSQAMSRNLFTKILNNFHLANNAKMPTRTSSNYSKTYKVDKFLEILENNFKKNYTLGEHVSVDESMIKFKGRSSLKQYVPMKPIKRGFKIWTIADSDNGYVYSFRIYKGKDTIRTESLGEHVVKDLVKDIKFSYRQVYFDNYFTTPTLLEYLYKKGIYAAGTIRVGRRNLPKDFCSSKKILARGDFEFITSGNLVLHKWMDRKLVFLLSNFHDPTSCNVIQRKNKNGGKSGVQCPTSIIDYNRFMGGVDRADQRKESYALDRKSRRSWLRIFFNFLNVTLSNSFVLYKYHTCSNITYLDFLSSITTDLIIEGATTKRSFPLKNSSRKKNRSSGRQISFHVPNNSGPHLPIISIRRRCAFCSTNGNEHRSIYHCSHCKRAFCITRNKNCFYDYHKNIL